MLAPADHGGTAMLRGLAGLPLVTPVLEPEARLQVVSVEDVAAAVSHSLTPEAKLRVKWDVAHPDVLTLETVVRSIRDWLGFRRRPVWRVPHGLGTVVSAVADLLGYLGWRSPARSTAVRQLSAGVVQTRNAATVAATARVVVIADALFTATAVIVQPISGAWLAIEMGISLLAPWIIASLMLYVLVGLCWLPVVWIQIQLRNVAAYAAERGRSCRLTISCCSASGFGSAGRHSLASLRSTRS